MKKNNTASTSTSPPNAAASPATAGLQNSSNGGSSVSEKKLRLLQNTVQRLISLIPVYQDQGGGNLLTRIAASELYHVK